MKCESCDTNIATWAVRIHKEWFGVCDDCFKEHKVCWAEFERPTCVYCDVVIQYGSPYCSYRCRVTDCGCNGDRTCCG